MTPTSTEPARSTGTGFGASTPPRTPPPAPAGRPPDSHSPTTDLWISPEGLSQPPRGLTATGGLHPRQLTGQQQSLSPLIAERRPEPPTSPPVPGQAQSVSPQAPVSMVQPTAGQSSARRAPQQARQGRSTLIPTAAGDETGAVPPQSAPTPQSRPVLEPPLWQITAEPAGLPEEPRLLAAGDDNIAGISQSPGEPQRRLALEPTSRPVAVERITSLEHLLPIVPPRSEASPIREIHPLITATTRPRPQMAPYVKPVAPPPRVQATATQELSPTIQVTIGRIEVRATPPPAPSAQKRRAEPPVMSLDAYLQQRSRGGDR